MEMCRWLFQGFTEIQNGRHGTTSMFCWAQKLIKLVDHLFLIFNITFLATCGCASDFLKMLPKFKMAARSQLKKFLWAQKLQNLSSEIIKILESHSPQYGNVQVIFLRLCCNSKWPPWINFNFFEVAKTQNLKVIQMLQITFPTIWRCACDFFKDWRKFKWPPCMNFIIFCGRKNSKIEVRNNVQVILLKFKMVDFLNICDRKKL